MTPLVKKNQEYMIKLGYGYTMVMKRDTLERELENHDVRLENLESVVSEQTKTLKSVENKITRLGGIIATVLFLSTPQGESIWKIIVG